MQCHVLTYEAELDYGALVDTARSRGEQRLAPPYEDTASAIDSATPARRVVLIGEPVEE
jgi:hypothetical protein